MWSAILGIVSSILSGEAASGGGNSGAKMAESNATNPAPAPTSGFAYTPGSNGATVDKNASQSTGFKPTKDNPGPWANAFKQEAKNFGASTAHNMLGAELDKGLEGTGVSGSDLMSLANTLFTKRG